MPPPLPSEVKLIKASDSAFVINIKLFTYFSVVLDRPVAQEYSDRLSPLNGYQLLQLSEENIQRLLPEGGWGTVVYNWIQSSPDGSVCSAFYAHPNHKLTGWEASTQPSGDTYSSFPIWAALHQLLSPKKPQQQPSISYTPVPHSGSSGISHPSLVRINPEPIFTTASRIQRETGSNSQSTSASDDYTGEVRERYPYSSDYSEHD